MSDGRALSASFTDVSDARRLQLLNAQLAYAASRSAYYREQIGENCVLTSLAALRTLPTMTEETLKTQGSRLSCVSAASVARIVSLTSSGTTDVPKRLFFTEGDLARTVDFFCEGMQWMCAAGDRAALFFPGAAPDGLNDLLSRGLAAFGALPTAYGPVTDAAEMAARLRCDAPDVLVGMPWQIRALALFLPALRPRAVLLSADYVPQSLIGFLRARWKCPVLTHYGMTESGYGLAVQHPSEAGMYHRRGDFILEILDPCSGVPVPDGVMGELVLTTLRREAMPLIRYRTGDLAVMENRKKIACVPGRIGIADGFYALQERLAPLPWLVDYAVQDALLSAHITADAPADCAQRLKALSGCNVSCRVSGSLLQQGKRSG